MKIAAVTDLHFRGKDLEHKAAAWETAVKQMSGRGVQLIANAGDTFETGKIIDAKATPGTLIRAVVEPLEIHGILMLAIAGNHDLDKPSQRSALAALEGHRLVTVVEAPTVKSFGDAAFACLPWCSRSYFASKHSHLDPAQMDEEFHKACLQVTQFLRLQLQQSGASCKILLGHCEVSGSVNRYRFLLPGSTYCFSNQELEAVEADHIWLGHYHLRQGYYLGALTQLNHGEEGNPGGWLLLDTDTGEKEFVELPEAPRYYTVALEDWHPENYREIDRVKLRGAVAPTILPANTVFDKIMPEVLAVERVEGLDPAGDLVELLAKWLKSAGEEATADDLKTPLKTILESNPGKIEALSGSLDSVDYVRVSGIGPHVDTEITFARDEWTAFAGPNGSGKSFLLEAPMAIWFGQWVHPHRGTLYSTMTAREASLDVVFTARGKTYRATRTLRDNGKTTKQTALLTLLESEEPIAGPKVRDFEDAVKVILGSREQILGSVFLSQTAEGDLVAEGSSGRREFLREYLALDRFEPLSVAAKAQAETLQANMQVNRQLVADLPGWVERKEEAAHRFDEAKIYAEALTEKIDELSLTLEKVREEGTQLRIVSDRREALAKGVQEARSDLAKAEKRTQELFKLFSDLDNRLEDLPRIKEQSLKLLAYQEELDGLNEQREKLRQAEAERIKLELQRDKLQATIDRQARMLEDDSQNLTRQIREKTERANSLKRVGCANNLLPCPLIDGAVADKEAIVELRARLSSVTSTLEAKEFAAEERAQVEDLSNKLLEPLPAAPDARRIQFLQTELSSLSRIERELGMGEALKSQLEHMRNEWGRAQEEEIEKRTVLIFRERELERNQDVTKELNSLILLHTQHKSNQDRLRAEQLSWVEKRGRADSEFKQAELKISELEEVQKSLSQEETELSKFFLLQRAFGKDGIPQLLIENAIPAIQDILSRVCVEDFGGAFGVRFDTQRENKDGGVREDFRILFRRRGKEYEARGCSGGEAAAVRAALRTALVLHQAQRSGEAYHVAFLDEPAAHQDADFAEATLKMLGRLRERFPQVLMVSHDVEQLASVGNVVQVEDLQKEAEVAA